MTNDENAIETLLMTAQINTDFVNPPMPSTTEFSTNLVRVETDSCESIINSLLPYKDYDSHKNAHKDFQKRFVDNPFGHGCSICDRLSCIRQYNSQSIASKCVNVHIKRRKIHRTSYLMDLVTKRTIKA
ncbi:uncharacterized protein TNCV_2783401 [Trichonephila clavipes]|nr:uncharacterized protein TNCV_2783401 [Trichonephila clavipes]